MTTAVLLLSLFVWNTSASAVVIEYGGTVPGTLSAAGEVDECTFDGNAGDRILVRIRTAWEDSALLELYDTSGVLIAADTGAAMARIDTVLADTGEYTLRIKDLQGNSTGAYRVHLQRRFGPGYADTLGYGQTQSGTLTQWAEIYAYTFDATAGDAIVARLKGEWASTAQLELYNPSGGLVAANFASSWTRIDAVLSTTGQYTLFVMDRDGDNTGNYGVHLQRKSSPGHADTLGYGQTVLDTITSWAEVHAYTFVAHSGDRIVTRISGDWQSYGQLELYDTLGALVASNYGSWGVRIDTFLADSGQYTLLAMDREGDNLGTYGVHLQRRFGPGNAVPLAYGTTKTDTLMMLAEIHAYTFTAAANDRIATRMCGNWQLYGQLELYNASGVMVASNYSTGGARIDTLLVGAGTYTLLVMDREGDEIGTAAIYGVHLQRRFTPGQAVALTYGQTVLDTTTQRADIHAYTITAAAGDRIVTRMSCAWTSSGRLELYDPTGVLLASHSGTGSARIDTLLATAGSYTLLVMDQEGDDTGVYGVCMQRRFTPGLADTLGYGQTDVDTLTKRAEIQTYKFTTGTANERILLRSYGNWGASCQIELYNATGGLVASGFANGGVRIDTVLTAAATYTLLVMDREGDGTGTYGVHLQRRFNPVGATTLEYGETAPGGISKPAETDAYTFIAEPGDRIVARTTGSWDPAPQLELYDSTSSRIAVNYGIWGARIDTVLLKGGKYTLLVLDKEGDNTGTYGLHLQRRFKPGHEVPLLYGDARTDKFTDWAEVRAFVFMGEAGDPVVIRLRSEWQFSGQMELYDSTGALVAARWGDWGCRFDTVLPRDGEYTLLILDSEGDDVGAFGVHVQRKFGPGHATTLDYGEADSDTIIHWAESRAFTFTAQAGDRIIARMRDAWQFSGRLELYDSSGALVATNQQTWGARIDTALTKAGQYTLLVLDPEGDNTGAFGIHVQRRFAPGHADTLEYGDALQDTITQWAEAKAYVFQGHINDGIMIQVTSVWASHAQLELYDSAGGLVTSKYGFWGAQTEVVLQKDGQYTILLMDRNGDDLGACGVRLEFQFTGVNELPGGALPADFALAQNYPNPFNSATTIRYALRQDCHAVVMVYDILGRPVRTLVDADQPAGRYAVVWDGRDDHNRAVASGIFLYRITAADFVMTRKMVLLK